jgi:hypothetical protein
MAEPTSTDGTAVRLPRELELSAAHIVGRLMGEIEAERDAMVQRIVGQIRREIPEFRRIPAQSLASAVQGTLSRAVAALRELRPPTEAELMASAAIGRERAEQGLAVDAVLHAYRISISSVWARFGELARERGADVSSVLAFSETLWLWADALMDEVSSAHREVELQLAREEQQLRDAFVLAALVGTADPAELQRDGAMYGLDADQCYVPIRARNRDPTSEASSRRLAFALAANGGLVAALEHDIAAILMRPPEPLPGLVAGVGPPARLTALPAAFALASRALQTALAFGREGVFSISDLSIRPAILIDEALGVAFVERYLRPLWALGRLGTELECTLRTWLEHDMQIDASARTLALHPNTLRHRLRRFEEVTGSNLRRPTDIIELWWALEWASLTGAGPLPAQAAAQANARP